jgi:hypothetical protein
VTRGPAIGITGTAQAIQDQRKSAVPDVIANVRVDQAWGSAQIMGALHEASGGYYGTSLTGSQGNGHPADKWGWAAGVGAKFNLPFIAPGDYVAFQAAYTEGAVRYVSNTGGGSGQAQFTGGEEMGYGFWSDGVYGGSLALGTATAVQLTTAWGIAGGWEHFWTPSLRTSFHGSYVEVKYNALANALICAAQTGGNGANTIQFTAFGAANFCDNNWSMWQAGSRTQWNVTKDFYMGFDVVYYRLNTASEGAVVNYTALVGGAQPTGLRRIADQDIVAGRVRWHRDIAP